MLTTHQCIRSRRQNHAGFTLIEVMITVAVIGILAAIAIPSYEFAIRKARRAEARTALMQMMQLQERYYSVQGKYLPFGRQEIIAAAPNTDLTRFKWYSADDPGKSHYELSGTIACMSGSTSCIKLYAVQSSANVAMFKDPQCGDYSLQSDGIFGNDKNTSPTSACW